MDCYARGLLAAAKLLEEGTLPGMVKDRYSSFDSGLGKVGGHLGRRERERATVRQRQRCWWY